MLSKRVFPTSYQLVVRVGRGKVTGALNKSNKPDITQLEHPKALSAVFQSSAAQNTLHYTPSTIKCYISLRKYTQVTSKPGKRPKVQAKKEELPQKSTRSTKQTRKLQQGSFPVFPAGNPSYLDINSDPRAFYIDKTHFIPHLEGIAKAVVLLAPRRFGKSLLLDTLACYYDISRAEKFEDDFGKRWIGQLDEFEHNGAIEMRPRKTELANKFYVLRLDFSGISQASSFAEFDRSINKLINNSLLSFCWHYPEVLQPPSAVPGAPMFSLDDDACTSFATLFDRYLRHKGIPVRSS